MDISGLHIFYTGTLVTPDDSDTNGYGEACEPGYGYDIADGWVDPDWTRFEVCENSADVRPDVWTPDDGPMIEWVADRIGERLGYVDGVDGSGTLYAADSNIDYRSGKEVRLAAHIKECPDAVLTAAEYLIMFCQRPV